MRDGEYVSIVLRLYLASGRVSFALWVASAIIAMTWMFWMYLP
jgi:hypothetical protein